MEAVRLPGLPANFGDEEVDLALRCPGVDDTDIHSVLDQARHVRTDTYRIAHGPFQVEPDTDDVAEFLRPYVDAGCRSFNLLTAGPDAASVDGAAEVRSLLNTCR